MPPITQQNPRGTQGILGRLQLNAGNFDLNRFLGQEKANAQREQLRLAGLDQGLRQDASDLARDKFDLSSILGLGNIELGREQLAAQTEAQKAAQQNELLQILGNLGGQFPELFGGRGVGNQGPAAARTAAGPVLGGFLSSLLPGLPRASLGTSLFGGGVPTRGGRRATTVPKGFLK